MRILLQGSMKNIMLIAVVVGLTLLSKVSCGNVGFTAAITADQVVADKQIVVYPTVISNNGNGYDNSTGVFTVPKGGIYLFRINVLSAKGTSTSLHLYKNETLIVSAASDSKASSESASNSAVLKVAKGDRVYVKSSAAATLVGKQDERYTTFSGMLVVQLSGVDKSDEDIHLDDDISIFINFRDLKYKINTYK